MEPLLPRPDPPNAVAVWSVPAGKKARPSAHYLVITAMLFIPMTLTSTLSSISFYSPDGTAIISFWPAAAFQIVFSIWFGIYGAIAGILGPMVSNSLVGDSPFQFVTANAIQSCLVGLWFRHARLDPRLRSWRDWMGLIFVGCIFSNALGAVAGVTESAMRHMDSGRQATGLAFWSGKGLTWFLANSVPSLILAPALLKAASAMIVRDPMFCQSFWGGTARHHRCRRRLRFADLPMSAKLLLLGLVTGILPLFMVAALSVWSSVKTADRLAFRMNQESAHEMRNEIERHGLLLRTWASELERTDRLHGDRGELLQRWRSVPDSFSQLEIVERTRIGKEMPPDTLRTFREHNIVFYRCEEGHTQERVPLRGVIGLESTPDEVLTGIVVWRRKEWLPQPVANEGGVLILDSQGRDVDRNVPPELADWQPRPEHSGKDAYTITHAGQEWHVAEARIPHVRFLAITASRSSLIASLAMMPNPVAILINLAIFGSIIAGSALAQRISHRVLTMAELVRETGGEPGKLKVPVLGRDELGYLAETLNRVSDQLAASVRELQETTAEKERLAAEMELARQVQRKILPSEPLQIAGYELAAASHPAREVGGDFFDWFIREDDKVITMIGDAAGKGLRAAMFITETHALAQAAARWLPGPDRILTAVNTAMLSERREAQDFVTMFCAALEPEHHHLLYACAGHNSPIFLREGRAQGVDLGDLPLAVLPEVEYPLGRIELAPGDTLVIYTDGITDAANTEGDFFGLERLETLAVRHADLSANDLLETILGEVRNFALGAPQTDDMTLVILRRCA